MNVYAIQHNVTKRIYVGMTGNVEFRIKRHLNALLRRGHTNKELQYDFDKYGFNYSFYLIEKNISNEKSKYREKYWMDVLGSNKIETGYNLSRAERPKKISDFERITLRCLRGKLAEYLGVEVEIFAD